MLRHPSDTTTGQWRCLVVEDGETLVWSGEDLKCCFCVCVRDPEALALLDGLRSSCATQPVQSWHIGRSVLLFQSGAHEVGVGHGGDSTPSSPSPVRSLSRFRRLEPFAELRKDRLLPSDDSSTTIVESSQCPTRGMVSSRHGGPQELYLGRGSDDSKWKANILGHPFRVKNSGALPSVVATSLGMQTLAMSLSTGIALSRGRPHALLAAAMRFVSHPLRVACVHR